MTDKIVHYGDQSVIIPFTPAIYGSEYRTATERET